MSLWPNTNMNTFSANGGLNLPGRSHATAYVSVGTLSNNDALLPFTVNSLIASPALDRSTAEVQARVTAMNYTFTSRPVNDLFFSARYRQYEFDNRTPLFTVTNGVNYDTAIVALNKESEPLGYTRHTFDGDASYSPFKYVGFRAGYTREGINRTYRAVEDTTEDTGRASIDLTGFSYVTVRGVCEHSKRAGSAVDGLELLSIGEQPLLRQFDISDRNQDRFNMILQITRSAVLDQRLGRHPEAGLSRAYFGLQNAQNRNYTIGFDLTPVEQVSFGAMFGSEKNTSLQASRTSNPLTANTVAYLNDPTQTFNDARRDWNDNAADNVRTVNATLDF